jgi:exopolysaccharide biosynthesis polyprenyl glycosylphosphotransferase
MTSITQGLPGRPDANESLPVDQTAMVLVGDGPRNDAVPPIGPRNNGSAPNRLDRPNGRWLREPEKTSNLRRHLALGDIIALTVVWVPLALVQTTGTLRVQLACAAAATATGLVAMERIGLYRARVCAVRSLEAVRVIAASIVGAGAFAFVAWLAGYTTWPSLAIGTAAAAVAVLGLRWRFGRWLKIKRSTGQFLRTVVLVGTGDDAVAVWRMVTDEPELGYRVGAVVGERRLDAPWGDLPTSDDVRQLGTLARTVSASGVIIVGSAAGAESTSTALNHALSAGLHVQIWPGLVGLSNRRVRMAPVLGVPVFYVEPAGKARWGQVAKRAMDITLAVAVLPVALPILFVTALLIKLEDRGPVLYHHRVVGRFGKPMTVLKLRTMVPNAAQLLHNVKALNERTGGPLFKASYDPRVTKIGRILRATSIDELPQLWDVITGKMSLVGPRFALPSEAEHFDEDLRRRTEMRPGMTGLWQSEARDNPSFSAYRRLDLFYVDNWSLSLDVAILANTLHGVGVKALRAFHSSVAQDRSDPVAVTEPVVQEP